MHHMDKEYLGGNFNAFFDILKIHLSTPRELLRSAVTN